MFNLYGPGKWRRKRRQQDVKLEKLMIQKFYISMCCIRKESSRAELLPL
jgi:hypothetical protein